jgi:hypothetical protein
MPTRFPADDHGTLGGMGAIALGPIAGGGEVTIDTRGVHVTPIVIGGPEFHAPVGSGKKVRFGAFGTSGSIGGYFSVGNFGAGAYVSRCP